jgi:hypothetical protein
MKQTCTLWFILLTLLMPLLVNASVDDTLAKCYKLELKNTELAVKYINQNHIDSLDMLYQQQPTLCREYTWNLLIKVFLMCIRYPQQIESINEAEMDFIIQYVNCVRNKNFIEGMGEYHEYNFNKMPTFITLHNAVQQYLSGIYGNLPIGTNESNLTGTLIGKQTSFFDQLNKENDSISTKSHQSFVSVKKDIRKTALFFLTPSTSLVINKKLGNSIQFDLGFELKIKRALFGYSLGLGFNTTDPSYILVYNDIKLKPTTRLNWTYNAWYNYLPFKESFINPYIGAGFGFQEGFRSQDVVNNNNVHISISTAQLYPEVGFLIGNWPNYLVKLSGSYRLSGYWAKYYGDIQEEELKFIDNLNLNSWRISFTVLIGMQKKFNQKAKLVGLW